MEEVIHSYSKYVQGLPHSYYHMSNVRSCWLAMPLGAGILRWLLACRTIDKITTRLYKAAELCYHSSELAFGSLREHCLC